MEAVPTIPRIERFVIADLDSERRLAAYLRKIFSVAEQPDEPVQWSDYITPECAEALGVNLNFLSEF